MVVLALVGVPGSGKSSLVGRLCYKSERELKKSLARTSEKGRVGDAWAALANKSLDPGAPWSDFSVTLLPPIMDFVNPTTGTTSTSNKKEDDASSPSSEEQIVLVDVPGRRRYMKNAIRGLALADAMVLIVPADPGELVAAFDTTTNTCNTGGDGEVPTNEYCLLDQLYVARALGIEDVLIVMSKASEVLLEDSESEERVESGEECEKEHKTSFLSKSQRRSLKASRAQLLEVLLPILKNLGFHVLTIDQGQPHEPAANPTSTAPPPAAATAGGGEDHQVPKKSRTLTVTNAVPGAQQPVVCITDAFMGMGIEEENSTTQQYGGQVPSLRAALELLARHYSHSDLAIRRRHHLGVVGAATTATISQTQTTQKTPTTAIVPPGRFITYRSHKLRGVGRLLCGKVVAGAFSYDEGGAVGKQSTDRQQSSSPILLGGLTVDRKIVATRSCYDRQEDSELIGVVKSIECFHQTPLEVWNPTNNGRSPGLAVGTIAGMVTTPGVQIPYLQTSSWIVVGPGGCWGAQDRKGATPPAKAQKNSPERPRTNLAFCSRFLTLMKFMPLGAIPKGRPKRFRVGYAPAVHCGLMVGSCKITRMWRLGSDEDDPHQKVNQLLSTKEAFLRDERPSHQDDSLRLDAQLRDEFGFFPISPGESVEAGTRMVLAECVPLGRLVMERVAGYSLDCVLTRVVMTDVSTVVATGVVVDRLTRNPK